MSLQPEIRSRLALPAVCAPMFLISNAAMVVAACKSGIVGALPTQNFRTPKAFEAALKDIKAELDLHSSFNPGAIIGPLAVNIPTQLEADIVERHLQACVDCGVDIIISAVGNPTDLTRRSHDAGLRIFHDVTTFRFAEKAIAAGVDGVTCIAAGGGGHSGLVNHLSLIPRIRAIFEGTILMAGSISNGSAIRAAEILGADLAYMGTRFIATKEAPVHEDYSAMLLESRSEDLLFTAKIAGVPANWLKRSIERVGLDPNNLPEPTGKGMSHDHLPENVQPWKNLWSAGQGIDLIDDIPSIAELVGRLRREYIEACEKESFAEVARLVERAES